MEVREASLLVFGWEDTLQLVVSCRPLTVDSGHAQAKSVIHDIM